MIEAHAAAVFAALRAVGLEVGDGTGDGLARPHAVVHLIPGRPYTTSARQDLDGRHVDVPIVIVGDSARSCRWMSQKLEDVLLDQVVIVAGRTTAPCGRIASTPAFPTNDLTPPAWTATDTYRITSVAG